MTSSNRPSERNGTSADERLETWKEIAQYFRRAVRTVKRWEKDEGLPVHRHVHKKLGTVYAHRSELDAWRDGRQLQVPSPAPLRDLQHTSSTRILIAVLPFKNLSGDHQQEYVADGLTEEMISQLGRFDPETLRVIARTTVVQYKGLTTPVRQIASDLGVDYVMEGSVRCETDRVRITAQLIDGRDQAHVWAHSYERSMRSILALQRELASDMAREIRLKLSPVAAAAGRGEDTVSPEAYQAHLKGRYFLNVFTPQSVRRSVHCFKRAIGLDPAYASSYASLAEAYERLPMWVDAPPGQTLPLALEAAQQALRLDADLPEAYASLGLIHANYVWDWAKAERYFQRAVELNPSRSSTLQWYAEFLAEMGRIDEALTILEPASRYDPLSRSIKATRAFALWLGRRFDEAIAEARAVLEIDSNYAMALIRLGVAYDGKGMYNEAAQAFRRAERAAPGLLDCGSLFGYACAQAGRKKEALEQLAKLRSLAKRRYVPAFLFANVCVGLRRYDEALTFIEKEYHSRGWYLLLLKESPLYDRLRSHSRFRSLIRRMNFPR
jgi:TolB-like protein/Tfp pilus assembly protein PilF